MVMEVVRDDSFMFETQEEKKVVAKETEPTGWPRRRKPVVEFNWEGWGRFVGGMWMGGELGDCCRD